MDLRSVQRPLKEKYRSEPGSSRITLRARGSQTDAPIACSGDLLLGALAACAQVTCQMVAQAMGIEVERIEVEGDLDLAGTLGLSREVPVGFERIRTRFGIVAPDATEEQLESLRQKTEQYCVVLQTLLQPPELETEWA
jgi:uncharacterized OsmC-like protein